MRSEVQGRDGDEVVSLRRNTDSCGQDPLEVLGWDLMMKILGNLDASSVAISLTVSRDWNGIASSDRLWTSMVEASEGEVAPEYWKNLDPYWAGTRPLMHRYFHQDGSQTADPGDRAWGGHECCFSVVTSILADGTIREHYVRINRWPRMSVSRKQDWSWEMSNHLVCYSSVPDSYKDGGTGPVFLVI